MERLLQWLGLNAKSEEGPKPLALFVALCVIIALTVLMSGCAKRAGCDSWSYIYVAEEDTLETKRQVLAHNLTLKELCAQPSLRFFGAS